MDIFARMVGIQLELLIYMTAGLIARKTGLVSNQNRSALLKVLLFVCTPCMLISAYNITITPEQAALGVRALLISAAVMLLSYGLGLLLFQKSTPGERSVELFGIMFSNCGGMGLPVIAIALGEVGLFYASMVLLAVTTAMWTIGLSVFIKSSWREKARRMLNPSVVAMGLGIGMMLTGFKLPDFALRAADGLGGMVAPLSMMLIGVTLAEVKMRELFTKSLFTLSAVRLLIVPLLLLLALRLARADALFTRTMVIQFSMPVASNAASFAENYGGDYHFASRAIVVSFLLSLATVPLLTLLF